MQLNSSTQKTKLKQHKKTEQKTVSTVYCQPETSVSWLQIIAATLALCALTIATYLPSLRYPFQFDDLQSISHYFNIRHATLSDLFMANRRWISYWLNACYFSWNRFNPFIYRVGNVLFHITAGLLLFTLIYTALKKVHNRFLAHHAFTLATITAGLFLMHPVQTQTVSYVIQGQLEGLAALATLATIALFFWYTQTQTMIARTLILMTTLSVAAVASCTKEIFVVTPLLVILFDWFFIAEGSWLEFKKRLVPHALLTLTVFGAFAYFSDPGFFKKLFGFAHEVHNGAGSLVTDSYTQTITSAAYIMSEFKVLLHYLWIFVWPFGLCADYDCALAPTFWSADVLIPLFILMGLAIFLIRRFLHNPTDPLVFGMLWFFIFVIPRSIIPSAELMNDYKTYGASVGLFFVMAYGITRLMERSGYQKWYMVLLLPLCLCSWQRNKVWATEKDFWADIIQKSPCKARAYNAYGVAFAKENNHAKARQYFQKAIELDPSYVPPYNNLAITCNALNDPDAAINIMQTMIQLNPNNPEMLSNLASFLIGLKRLDEAKPYLQKALELRPHYGKAHFHLGRLYYETGTIEAAYEAFKKACTQGDFDTVEGFYFYGKACLLTNRLAEAEQAYKKAYQLFPNSYDLCFEYGNIQCMQSNFKEAQTLYKKAYAMKQSDPNLLFNLGEAYWGNGCYEEALIWFKKAEEKKSENPALAMRLAGCYARLGDPEKARIILEQFLKNKPPADLKMAAQQALAKMKTMTGK